eukprot:TRINITY_DN49299_c0_g1_i1.p1 TRINITY_DN49299_c0_g1~~TRINITY_DN49299_c0_g1_i1.p1  ORF type:complete len:356 (-),score=58.31 TRINITY_DN49299_c0_g1_i1:28-1095(-)
MDPGLVFSNWADTHDSLHHVKHSRTEIFDFVGARLGAPEMMAWSCPWMDSGADSWPIDLAVLASSGGKVDWHLQEQPLALSRHGSLQGTPGTHSQITCTEEDDDGTADVLVTPRASPRSYSKQFAAVALRRGAGDDDSAAEVCFNYLAAKGRLPQDAADSCLIMAIQRSNIEDLKALLDGLVEDVDLHYEGQRPLHYAIRRCHKAGDAGHVMTELLLQHGAKACKKEGDAEAPLVVAAGILSPATHLLLGRGADAHACSASGETVLDVLTKRLHELGCTEDGALCSQKGELSRVFSESRSRAGMYMKDHVKRAGEQQQRVMCFAVRTLLSRRLPSPAQDIALSYLVPESGYTACH